ncbi:MAG: hypothetical protein Q8L64_04015 [bacterium]|nr:hypothetical protein [bacterium]
MSSSKSPKGLRVLLAEGDMDTGSMLFSALQQCGHELVATIAIENAKEELEKGRFDVLITSQHLPINGDGDRLIAYVNERYPEMKTILFSGRARPPHSRADVYLSKPSSIDEIDAEIRTPKKTAVAQ